jgi:pyruvate-ferredoxin/flavodoxin oxidoreductase
LYYVTKVRLFCPHAAIRAKVYDQKLVEGAPETFKWTTIQRKDLEEGLAYTIQVAVEDCTGCNFALTYVRLRIKKKSKLKAINMAPQIPIRETERTNFEFFLELPEFDRSKLNLTAVKDSQFP